MPVVPYQPPDGSAAAPDRRPGDDLRRLLAQGRAVVADFPAAALDGASASATGEVLRGTVHAVLAGDSPRNRVQLPPAYRAALIRSAGLRAWTGLNCRDRNRVALEGELAALVDLGVDAVHCVTGDHPALGSRWDAAAVFDLDSTQLTGLAARSGLLTSVGESPSAPPTDRRAGRLVEKLRAGAEVCFVNHCGGVDPIRTFVDQVHQLGGRPWFVPCVPVVLDVSSAQLLASFPGFVLPPGYLEPILEARDPRARGIRATVDLCEQLLALDGVAGVNLSGGGAPGRELAFAEGLAEIGQQLGTQDS
ncbi:methylenetetrahydrofolate reductase [uncultured Friedmanniella sp.]|uniref:methylenetetrahydrofolate reductase n=1 Tax=uncultured Friedmanniella sp. TaxID=335381 RepID=UPI0035C9B5B5